MEGTLDPDVVDKRNVGSGHQLEGYLEGLDPDAVGRIEFDVVVGKVESNIGSGRCCWKGVGSDVNWKGWIDDVVVDCSD